MLIAYGGGHHRMLSRPAVTVPGEALADSDHALEHRIANRWSGGTQVSAAGLSYPERAFAVGVVVTAESYVAFMKVRDAIKLLEDDGWRVDRQRGSHRQYRHPRKPGLVTVAGKPNSDLKPGTLASIRRQAGLGGPSK
jgi:predicted RNA binding protein YcfA (HicA-like mRNA interferase family)